jgi:hypothetical protein
MSTDQGPTGERGQQGDHGQTGEEGMRGHIGETGAAGHAGVQGVQGVAGQTGEQGTSGKASSLTYTKVLAGFLIMMLTFGILAWRSQMNTDNIKRIVLKQQTERYNSCLTGVDFVKNQNQGWRDLAAIDKDNPSPTTVGIEIQAERIKVLESLIFTPEPTKASCERFKP